MRVLVIENQTPLVQVMRRSLEEEGFRADVAVTPEEGRIKAQAFDYALILVSLSFPHDGGAGLLKQLRQTGPHRQLLALTGHHDPAERVRCLELGADDYLGKPFPLQELVARCRALLRRAHRIFDPVIRVHDLEIDTSTRAVKRAGQPIALTRRQYALLQLLAFHRGRVVSRTTIWQHLYDDEDATTSNVVDVFVRYLRAKVDKGFHPPLILTRWGEGYLLRGDEPATHDVDGDAGA